MANDRFILLPPLQLVGEAMSRKLSLIGLDDSLGTAAKLMKENSINYLPVVDRSEPDNPLVGVLSERDILRLTQPSAPPNPADPRSDHWSHPVHRFIARKLIKGSPVDSLYEAAKCLAKTKVGALLVLTSGSQSSELVGILTVRDVLRSLIDAPRRHASETQDWFLEMAPAFPSEGGSSPISWEEPGSVVDLMSPEATTLSPVTPVRKALRLITEKHIRHLPVLSKQKLVGIVSDKDILRVLRPRPPAPRAEGPNRVIGDEFGDAALEMPISRIMSARPTSVTADASLLEACEAICKHRVSGLPVMRKGQLAGVITTSDYIQLLADQPPGVTPDSTNT